MADVRRDKSGKPVRKAAIKTLGKLSDAHLFSVRRLVGMIEEKEIELKALTNHYQLMTSELAEEYNLPSKYTIDFATGKILEATDA